VPQIAGRTHFQGDFVSPPDKANGSGYFVLRQAIRRTIHQHFGGLPYTTTWPHFKRLVDRFPALAEVAISMSPATAVTVATGRRSCLQNCAVLGLSAAVLDSQRGGSGQILGHRSGNQLHIGLARTHVVASELDAADAATATAIDLAADVASARMADEMVPRQATSASPRMPGQLGFLPSRSLHGRSADSI
jgi:hypothetical protein